MLVSTQVPEFKLYLRYNSKYTELTSSYPVFFINLYQIDIAPFKISLRQLFGNMTPFYWGLVLEKMGSFGICGIDPSFHIKVP